MNQQASTIVWNTLTAAARAHTGGVLDIDHLRRYTLGDSALEKEVLGLFIGQLPQLLESLQSAKTERDWKMAAHSIKGSARAVGAFSLANAAEDAETVLRPLEPARRERAVRPIDEAVASVIRHVRSHLS